MTFDQNLSEELGQNWTEKTHIITWLDGNKQLHTASDVILMFRTYELD